MGSSGAERASLSLTTLGVLLLAVCAFAEGGTVANPPSPPAASKSPRWEYVVVSAGKAYFSSVDESSLGVGSKAAVAAKSRFDNEAVSLQGKMDQLGQLGWELVAVVGAIGGDQELIFKRPYVLEVIEAESALRRKEASRIATLLSDVGRSSPQESGPRITDLDEKERLERLGARMASFSARLEADLPSMLGQGVKVEQNDVEALPRYPTFGDEATLGGTLVVDATERLLSSANTYRSSEANSLARTICAALIRIGLPNKGGRLAEPIIVKVNIQGKTVATQGGSTLIEMTFCEGTGRRPPKGRSKLLSNGPLLWRRRCCHRSDVPF